MPVAVGGASPQSRFSSSASKTDRCGENSGCNLAANARAILRISQSNLVTLSSCSGDHNGDGSSVVALTKVTPANITTAKRGRTKHCNMFFPLDKGHHNLTTEERVSKSE